MSPPWPSARTARPRSPRTAPPACGASPPARPAPACPTPARSISSPSRRAAGPGLPHAGPVDFLAFAPGGRRLAAVGPAQARVWDVTPGAAPALLWRVPEAGRAFFDGLDPRRERARQGTPAAFSPDGRRLL